MLNGYVYVVETESGKVKIGVSTKPKHRIASLQTATYERLKNIHISNKCFNYLMIEEKLHKFFNKNRLNGEWFDVRFEDAVNKLNEHKFLIDENETLEKIIITTARIPKKLIDEIREMANTLNISTHSLMLKMLSKSIQ